MANFDGWETMEPPLGEGGQGTVYKARDPKRVELVRDSAQRLEQALRSINGNLRIGFDGLAKLILEVGKPDEPKDLGALKVFKFRGDERQIEKALARLETEITALKRISNPAVIKHLYSNLLKGFMVTEYHPLGTLNAQLSVYQGRALEALLAFKPLVEAIALIHNEGAIHRDIKTENIFVATDGRLVLGDFGIVFFADEQRTRLTDVYGERVGSHFWMAPWAYEPVRLPIDEIKPSLDIFPLGKIRWSMIAGRDGPLYWEYDRPQNNLVNLFPDDPAMPFVNTILSKSIVREERDCAQSASDLGSLVDEAIGNIRHLDRRSEGNAPWLCLVCKKGRYGKEKVGWRPQGFFDIERNNPADIKDLTVYFCDHCGHAQFFKRKWVPSL
jgi:serine/threonine protein kinase